MHHQIRSKIALHTVAICKAVHTSVAGISGAIAQSTILRECKSGTAAGYSQALRKRQTD